MTRQIRTGETKTFRAFIDFMKKKPQRVELGIWAAVLLALGVALHLLYPTPFVFPDSGSYVNSAASGTFNVYRPMGYSQYLGLLHGISPSLTFVFVFSYAIHALSTLWLLFSAKYLLEIRDRRIFGIFCLFAVAAPRLLFCTNFLMSDSLFHTLTVLFVTTVLWVACSRNPMWLIWHLSVFAVLYEVRYAGMFYLPITLLAVWSMPSGSVRTRVGYMALPVLVFGLLYMSAKRTYMQQTGVDTFSAFSGWQLLNNASVLIPEANRELTPESFASQDLQTLHAFMRTCPDSVFSERNMLETFCMWDNKLPYKYFLFHVVKTTGRPYANAWVALGVLYGEYARELIRHYPMLYVERFLWPSVASLFRPMDITEERFALENEPMYRDYYGLTAERYEHAHRVFAALNPVRRAMHYVYWSALGLSLACLAIAWKSLGRADRKRRQLLLMLAAFVVVYLGASALASPNTAWRYTMPVFLPSLALTASLADYFLDMRRSRRSAVKESA